MQEYTHSLRSVPPNTSTTGTEMQLRMASAAAQVTGATGHCGVSTAIKASETVCVVTATCVVLEMSYRQCCPSIEMWSNEG